MYKDNNPTLKTTLVSLFVLSLLFVVATSAQTVSPVDNKIPVSEISKVHSNLSRGIKISDCRSLDIEGSTYILQSDIYSSGTCLTVMADNIRILGKGHSIFGQDNLESFGIHSENNQNLEIKNLEIKNYGTGINISSGTQNVTIDNVLVLDSADISINVYDADNIEIKNSEFRGNEGSIITLFTAKDKPIHANIVDNTFKQNNGNAIKGIGLIADIKNNLLIDNGEPTQQPHNRGIWIRSIIERPAPGHVKVPARANIKNNILVRIGGSGIVCSAYDGNYCDIDRNFLKDIYGPAAISFGPVGSVTRNNLIINSDHIGIDVIKRQVRDVLVENNVILNSTLGISVEPGIFQNQFVEDVKLLGNTIVGSKNGIYIIGLRHDSTGHIIKNNIVKDSLEDAFYLKGNRLSDVVFENNKVSDTADGFLDFNIASEGINDLKFVNNTFGKYSFAGSGTADASFLINDSGKIDFLENLSGVGVNLSEEIKISFNSAIIDDENNSDLNIPATVTLYDMPGNFDDPAVFRDGIICFDCVAQGGLNEETVTFEVPDAGNYWVDEK